MNNNKNTYGSRVSEFNLKTKKTGHNFLIGMLFVFAVAVEMLNIILILPVYNYIVAPIFKLSKLKDDNNIILKAISPRYFKDNKVDINTTARGYLYLAPALIVIFTFVIYPFISAFLMGFISFTTDMTASFKFTYYDWSILEVIKRLITFDVDFYKIITLQNFWYVLTDDDFWKAMWNTTIIVVVSVPLSIIIGLVIAVMLNAIPYLKGLFQTVYFLPYVTAMVAVLTVWRWFFYKDPSGQSHGLINYLLSQVGITPIDWLYGMDGPHYQLVAFIIYSVWSALAFKIVIFLTGLQNINKEYYQAAQVDGTSKFRTFTKITVPQLSPIILFVSLTSMIGAFKVFTSVQAMFGNAGLENSVLTIVYYVYKHLSSRRYDVSAASAVILFFFILTLTTLQLAYSKRRIHY